MSKDHKDKLNVIGCYNCIHDIGGGECGQDFDGSDVRQCHVHIADIGDEGYEPGSRFKEE